MAEEFSFSKTKNALDEIAKRIAANRSRITQASDTVGTAVSDLDGMTGAYGPIIIALGTEATSNPENPAIQSMKAEGDALVAEFDALKSVASAKKTAYDEA